MPRDCNRKIAMEFQPFFRELEKYYYLLLFNIYIYMYTDPWKILYLRFISNQELVCTCVIATGVYSIYIFAAQTRLG